MKRKNWAEFASTGLLWWVNRSLHIFGWSIVYDVDEETGAVVDVYPARVKFRGFSPTAEERGFERLTSHIHETADDLLRDTIDDDNGGIDIVEVARTWNPRADETKWEPIPDHRLVDSDEQAAVKRLADERNASMIETLIETIKATSNSEVD